MLTPYNLLGLIRVTLQASFDADITVIKADEKKHQNLFSFVPSKRVSLEIQRKK